jgi:homoserine O-acetyltransferase
MAMTDSATEPKSFTTRDFRLQSGVVMPEVTIAYRTLGTLSPKRDNAVLITHGNTSGPQMIDPGGSTGEGSWNALVGPGQAVDTNRFFAIWPNFPDITVRDIVGTQRLLLDSLGIEKLVAIVGPSYGGFQAFQWAVDYPDAMKGIAPVLTAPRVPRERSEGNVTRLVATLSQDRNWNGGDYYDYGGVLESMTQIRIATLKTYGIETRLRDTLSDPIEIETAIRDEATKWAEGFDANSLLILAKALRSFDVTAELGKINAKVLYILSRTDKLFPPELEQQVMPALKAAGVDADYFLLDSDYGHSASGRDAHKWAPRLRQLMDGLG